MGSSPFFERTLEAQKTTFMQCDFDALRTCNALMSKCLQVKQMLNAFHRSPRRSIAGRLGVAKQLGITPSAVQKRLEWLNLKADHFRDPEATYDSLLRASSSVQLLVRELEKMESRYSNQA